MIEEPRISLTEYVDIMPSGGTCRAAKYRITNIFVYSVFSDFCKTIPKHIANIHRQHLPKRSFQTISRQIGQGAVVFIIKEQDVKIGTRDTLVNDTLLFQS